MTNKQLELIKNKTEQLNKKVYELTLRKDKPQVKRKKKWKPKKKLRFKKRVPIKFKSYNEYMASSLWRRRRKQILKRANYMCESCKIRKATQVHHKTYKHLFNEYPNELIALCGTCHLQKHDLLTEEYIEKKSTELLKSTGFI